MAARPPEDLPFRYDGHLLHKPREIKSDRVQGAPILVPKKFAKLMGKEATVPKKGVQRTKHGLPLPPRQRPVIFVDQLRRLTETMMHRLTIFRKEHGHCAVPPDDSLGVAPSTAAAKDVARLADWCSLQRQIYRQIRTKYREATEEESKVIDRLYGVGFCWDYEAWHWEESFRLTQEHKELCEAAKQGMADEALAWVRDQRRRYKRGMEAYPPGRVKKLKTMDVIVI